MGFIPSSSFWGTSCLDATSFMLLFIKQPLNPAQKTSKTLTQPHYHPRFNQFLSLPTPVLQIWHDILPRCCATCSVSRKNNGPGWIPQDYGHFSAFGNRNVDQHDFESYLNSVSRIRSSFLWTRGPPCYRLTDGIMFGIGYGAVHSCHSRLHAEHGV